ncbi:hypothetical protein C0Q70_07800 [Pomacea canaliculata]|uniref:PLC-beta PH domain-containing protein n=1 Tax=Pomacea canaliculata TaxID=400727 RepID=A0A2T7PG12_POMCA|nr:hypothetical protein C0Q70_07800 [Pomacea canaliculata]
MAGAKPGVHVVQLKPISVPEDLLRGNKFIMWNDTGREKVTPAGLEGGPTAEHALSVHVVTCSYNSYTEVTVADLSETDVKVW